VTCGRKTDESTLPELDHRDAAVCDMYFYASTLAATCCFFCQKTSRRIKTQKYSFSPNWIWRPVAVPLDNFPKDGFDALHAPPGGPIQVREVVEWYGDWPPDPV